MNKWCKDERLAEYRGWFQVEQAKRRKTKSETIYIAHGHDFHSSLSNQDGRNERELESLFMGNLPESGFEREWKSVKACRC